MPPADEVFLTLFDSQKGERLALARAGVSEAQVLDLKFPMPAEAQRTMAGGGQRTYVVARAEEMPPARHESTDPTIALSDSPSASASALGAHSPEDRYVLGKELGRGGLGKVVLALDRNFMDREVAMKLMLSSSAREAPPGVSPGTPPARERFLEEAQITGQLWHPNIIAALEIGTRPSGDVFYTMPVVRGMTLRDEIREAHAKLDSGETQVDGWGLERMRLLSAFQGLCNGISYAHETIKKSGPARKVLELGSRG